MTQGLFAAASGIRNNQAALDVISNNIANVNTLGFKASRAQFATVFARTISGGTSPNSSQGGTNPLQVGNGAFLSEIATNFSQGGSQYTGRSTDLSINGEGFFAVERVDRNLGTANSGYFLTRAGNFSLDAGGNLVTSGGDRLRGTSQLDGTIPDTLGLINVPLNFQVAKYLDANNNILGTSFGSGAAVGADFAADATARGITPASTNTVTASLVNFSIGQAGNIVATYSNGDRITTRPNPNPAVGRTEIVHYPSEGGTFGSINFAGDTGSSGQLGGGLEVFTNTSATADPMEGMQLQLQTATVVNPGGLTSEGNNNYLPSANSGDVFFGTPGASNRGKLLSGSLESSNVELASEFTQLVITQRGLEAASRVIRTQSDVLQSVINIVN